MQLEQDRRPAVAAHSVAAVRAAEGAALAGLPPGAPDALMQQAATAVAVTAARALREATGGIAGRAAVLLVGSGDNGGDALWAGVRLRRRGVAVTALLSADTAHPAGLAAVRVAGARVLRVSSPPSATDLAPLAAADLVIDGLVGLGGRPGLREPATSLVDRIPASAVVVAVDVPSGVDVDSGALPGPHVQADVTVTLGAAKRCLLLPPASTAAGRVEVFDLGFDVPPAPLRRLDAAGVGALWPVPAPGADKYRRGVLGMVAGSAGYPGAAVLATSGAVRAGVGMLRYVGPDDATRAVRSAHPEVVAGAGRVQAWALGSGVNPDADDDQPAAIRSALDSGLPCLLDAGALEVWAAGVHRDPDDASDRLLLTPHAGELASLLGTLGLPRERADVEERPFEHAHAAAELTGACVLLKGATTLVVTPDGEARSQAEAPAWLATAGAGDVLAGVAGALLAGGVRPLDAGAAAAWVHGRAATLASRAAGGGGGPIAASDVAAHVPAAVAEALAP
ncbi:NAD(P)H-hydrate epimerase [Spongisporangium articulatum]|uniref:Bifunctional NAD(P)H-hydrate repair enzyme n=1 Tax=Spongisporangium articulatum TaxID=3362603 RepID=A0ABW8AP62_9ACTN